MKAIQYLLGASFFFLSLSILNFLMSPANINEDVNRLVHPPLENYAITLIVDDNSLLHLPEGYDPLESSHELEKAYELAIHQVRQGESLFLISRHYGITVESLKKLNQLDSDEIQVNQLLQLPFNS